MWKLSRPRIDFSPLTLGPAYEAKNNLISVKTGPLAGKQLQLSAEVSSTRADFFLTPFSSQVSPDPILAACGHCHFDRNHKSGLETLYDIFVRPDFRRSGIATLLLRLSFRRLLTRSRQCWFAIRKLMKVDTRRRELHNIGIGLLAVKLGFRPEPDLERILRAERVQACEILPATTESPPGLLLHLRDLPGVVVAAELFSDPEGKVRPVVETDHYRRFFNPELLAKKAREGSWIVGNIDYLLSHDTTEHFARHLADSPEEYRLFLRSLAAGAKHQKS